MWGFRLAAGRGRPDPVALALLETNTAILGLDDLNLTLRALKESVGAYHVMFEQRYRKRRIHRAYVSVHMDRHHTVYLVKNRAVPRDVLEEQAKGAASRRHVDRALAIARQSAGGRRARPTLLEGATLWFPVGHAIRPAFKYRFRSASGTGRPQE